MSHNVHQDHEHIHAQGCGHIAVEHEGHIDYAHDGHLHHWHGDHYDEHVIEVSQQNPASCAPVDCGCQHQDQCGHESIPHGDHVDYLHNGQLHHPHGDHCDNHGTLATK